MTTVTPYTSKLPEAIGASNLGPSGNPQTKKLIDEFANAERNVQNDIINEQQSAFESQNAFNELFNMLSGLKEQVTQKLNDFREMLPFQKAFQEKVNDSLFESTNNMLEALYTNEDYKYGSKEE